MTAVAPSGLMRFTVPAPLIASEPPEIRGLSRDAVRFMIARGDRVAHTTFRHLSDELRAGDLVVVNTSATIPAAVAARRERGEPVVVHFATELEDETWIVELRRPDGSGPQRDGVTGEQVHFADGSSIELRRSYGGGGRLWHALARMPQPVSLWLQRYGAPIRYGHSARDWPLSMYQTIFAREPGSAEMPSAARPFTPELVVELVTRGVRFAPLVLHAGVSSMEVGEGPLRERFHVPATTASLVNVTRHMGHRVIAVGTTVARALETVASNSGAVSAGCGWTDLVLSQDRPARVVDALITGWHEPESSHLLLLEAIAGARTVQRAYEAALAHGYLWHEFGDSCLLVREPAPSSYC